MNQKLENLIIASEEALRFIEERADSDSDWYTMVTNNLSACLKEYKSQLKGKDKLK